MLPGTPFVLVLTNIHRGGRRRVQPMGQHQHGKARRLQKDKIFPPPKVVVWQRNQDFPRPDNIAAVAPKAHDLVMIL